MVVWEKEARSFFQTQQGAACGKCFPCNLSLALAWPGAKREANHPVHRGDEIGPQVFAPKPAPTLLGENRSNEALPSFPTDALRQPLRGAMHYVAIEAA